MVLAPICHRAATWLPHVTVMTLTSAHCDPRRQSHGPHNTKLTPKVWEGSYFRATTNLIQSPMSFRPEFLSNSVQGDKAIMAGYARYFKKELLSDCNIVISWPAEDDSSSGLHRSKDGDEMPRSSRTLPGHQIVLIKSSIFEAQALRWQEESSDAAPNQQGRPAGTSAGSSKPVISISLNSKEQLPAAESVLAALYCVKDCLCSLSHDQLLHALVLADMLDIPEVVHQTIMTLASAISSATGLSEAALRTLGRLPAWPDCLEELLSRLVAPILSDQTSLLEEGIETIREKIQPEVGEVGCLYRLAERKLLATFQDLQAVWQDTAAEEQLMQLPPLAFLLLMSSDELQVPSEDIVWYTVVEYIHRTLKPSESDNRAGDMDVFLNTLTRAIGMVVRLPYLSSPTLHRVSAYYDNNARDGMFFTVLTGGNVTPTWMKYRLSHLVGLRLIIGDAPLQPELEQFPGAPQCWLKGSRQLVDQRPASVVWRLPIRTLADTCRKVAQEKWGEVIDDGPVSPPIGGLTWRLLASCQYKNNGSVVGLTVKPCLESPSPVNRVRPQYCPYTYTRFRFSVTCQASGRHLVERDFDSGFCLDWDGFALADFFKVGPMSGGWDEAAWAAKGLPTSGDLVLELVMLKVW